MLKDSALLMTDTIVHLLAPSGTFFVLVLDLKHD